MVQDLAGQEAHQRFVVEQSPQAALDRAHTYLEGAGTVATQLAGHVERRPKSLVARHGRVDTHVTASLEAAGTVVEVRRHGEAPLENTRQWLIGAGIGGFLIAWALAVFNRRQEEFLDPLVTVTLFFVGMMALVVVLYFVDRSLERRSQSLILGLEDAVRGDPLLVLRREVDALERSSSVANAILFYFACLLVEFIVFAILWTEGIREAIDQVVTLQVMRTGFLLPVVPALAFGLIYRFAARRIHRDRFALVRTHQ